MQPRIKSLFFIALVIGTTFANISRPFAAPFIVGIAPSIPEPISELEEINEKKQRKRAKKHLITTTPLQVERLPTKEQAWQKVFDHIAQESSLELKFEPASSQLQFELNLAKGYYDLAYINPLQFNAFRDFPGYQAQVKRKSQPSRGMVFVKKVGTISTLADLREATIAFPDPLNFSGSVITRESLQRLDFRIIPQFLASQSLVYSEVMKGQYIAGGGTTETFHAQAPEIKNSLKIIWDSPGFSPYAFVAHPRVDFFSLTKIKRAFVRMVKDEESKALLKHIFVDNGFEVARDSDWDEIKSIDLSRLNGTNKSTKAPEPEIGM